MPDTLAKANRYRWLIFSILACGYILVYFHRLCPAVLAVDMMRDLKSTGALTGLLGAAYFYPYALMQLPAGLLSDSWGPRNTITLFFIVAFAGSLILGWANSVFAAIFGRTLVGLGIAMLFVPTLKILAEWFQAREFALMTGILMALGGVGSLSAATPLAWLSAWIGWRLSFVTVGVFTLLLAVLVYAFVRNRPSDLGWPSPAKQAVSSQPEQIGLMQAVRRVIACAAFWWLACWFFFELAIFFTFGGLWGGPFLTHIYDMDRSQAARILSMMAIGMIIGSPCLSYASNNIFKGRKPVLILCSVLTLIQTGLLAFYTDRLPVPALYLLCLGFGVFTSAVVVIAFTNNKELFPVQMAGTATGLINLFPFAGGAVFQPLLGGILEHYGRVGDRFTLQGYQSAFLVLFLCALIALVASFFLKETMTPED